MHTKKLNYHFFKSAQVYHQLPVKRLIAQTLERNCGVLSDTGALVINTGRFTGRSPADKFIVHDSATAAMVDWNKFNHPFPKLDSCG